MSIRRRWINGVGLVVYGLLAVLLVIFMYQLRGRVVSTQSTAESQAAWDEWVAEAERQSQGQGPVRRNPPQSPKPPALVLMQDHFGTCLLTLLLLSSALYGALFFLVRGVLTTPPPAPALDREPGSTSRGPS